MNTTIAADSPILPEPSLIIAGFWRRLFALIIDLLMLGVLGLIIGVLFFDPLARMGETGKLIGFAIALGYFGLCNSGVFGGQTLAMRWLGVRVVDAQGDALSLPRSMLRYVVLGVPFFANGTSFSPQLMISSVLDYVLALIVFGGILAIIYLYIFNRRTRQSLHDLAVGSYVVQAVPNKGKAVFPPIWKGHLVVVIVLALLALGTPAMAKRLARTNTFGDMMPTYQMLSTQPHVISVQVVHGRFYFNGNVTRSIQVALRMDAPMTDNEVMAKHIAQMVAKSDPDIASEDTVRVTLRYGYTIGISSGWKSHGYSYKPDELK